MSVFDTLNQDKNEVDDVRGSGQTWSIFCFWSFQGERGEHGPPGKGDRGEPGPAGPKVRLDPVPGAVIWIYGLFKSSFVYLNLPRCPRRGRRGRPGCPVLKGQRSALFSFSLSPDLSFPPEFIPSLFLLSRQGETGDKGDLGGVGLRVSQQKRPEKADEAGLSYEIIRINSVDLRRRGRMQL